MMRDLQGNNEQFYGKGDANNEFYESQLLSEIDPDFFNHELNIEKDLNFGSYPAVVDDDGYLARFIGARRMTTDLDNSLHRSLHKFNNNTIFEDADISRIQPRATERGKRHERSLSW